MVVRLAGQHELEAGPVRADVLVEEVAAVRLRVRLRDGEPDTGALSSLPARRAAAGETLEQLGDELGRHAPAMVDRAPQVLRTTTECVPPLHRNGAEP